MKLPFYHSRSRVLNRGFDLAYPLYRRWGRRRRLPWTQTKESLLTLPENSLGHRVGAFLATHRLELLPGYENHDVCHVLLEYPTTAAAEATLQWHLLGNGKRSPFCWLAALSGGLFFPEHWSDFYRAFRKGRQQVRFFDWLFADLLDEPISELRILLSGQVGARGSAPNRHLFLTSN